jgi:hypothetical protein
MSTHLFMSTSPKQKAGAYRLSFIINTAIGGTLILVGVLEFLERVAYPVVAHTKFEWGFELTGILCLIIAYICHRKYWKYLRLCR